MLETGKSIIFKVFSTVTDILLLILNENQYNLGVLFLLS